MKNLIAYPPNYEEILAVFPAIVGKPVVFAYGDTLYNPTGAIIPPDLKVHEETHELQQKEYRGGASQWWKQYLFSPDFRLDQEAKAYRAQYKYLLGTESRQVARAGLRKFVKDLSGAIYGHICSAELAEKLITQI